MILHGARRRARGIRRFVVDMKTLFAWAIGATAVLTVIVAAMPAMLRRRGVQMCRTMFGLTLIFDSENADGTPVRLINVNGTFQSVSYVPEDLRFELACEYHREIARRIESLAAERGARNAQGERLRVLIMGGGGCSLPKYLATYVPEAEVEVVEIDPAMAKIARDQFWLDECLKKTNAEQEGRFSLVIADAWAHLKAATEPYDVIVNEAFGGKRPLGPMETNEGARVVREHLSDGGIYLADVRCPMEGRRSAPLREVEESFGRVFASCDVVPEWEGEPEKPGNNVFIAR